MEQAKVQSAMSLFNEHIPQEKLYTFKQMLEKADDAKYNELMTIPMKSTITTLLLSVFLGGIGADRFYVGDTGLGVVKLLLGWLTFGLWPLIDIFFSYKKAKLVNFNKILSVL